MSDIVAKQGRGRKLEEEGERWRKREEEGRKVNLDRW